LERPNITGSKITNLLDKDHNWMSRNTSIQRDVETMNITTVNNRSNINASTAILTDPLNLTGKPIFLSVHYYTNIDNDHDNFIIEINDDKGNLLWDARLENTNNIIKKNLHVLPEDVSGKKINLGIRMDAKDKWAHTLTLKKLSLHS
jgi:hypothetical protein